MSYRLKLTFIIFIIATLVPYSNGCDNKMYDITTTEKINVDYLGRNVVIDDKVDVSNIIYIILQTEKQPVDEDIKNEHTGYFTLSDGTQVPIKISSNYIIIGGYKYNVQNSYEMLWNIFSKYIYDIDFIIKKVEECNLIKLYAKDVNTEYVLNKNEIAKLSEILSNSEPKRESGPGIFIEYPYYEVTIELNNGSNVNIVFLNNSLISVNDGDFDSWYTTTNDLLEYISTLLPTDKIKDEYDIKYLYNSSKVTVINSIYEGEYIYKASGLARILSEGIKTKSYESNEQSLKLDLIFTINNDNYNVYVYENYFKYLDNYYSLPNAFNLILNILAAG